MCRIDEKDFSFYRLGLLAEQRKLTREEQIAYDRSLKSYRDTVNVMKSQVDAALQKGREEGKIEGQKEAYKRMAKLLKKDGTDINTIIRITGLSKDEVLSI